ncbi:MAG: dihydropteroate synthase [Candidatus Aminicenantes bacterium]|nr:dihydropteroate synthase [Candidatus Aminicenantes bacterium]
MKLVLKERSIDLKIPLIMGILNITPDSFSDGGQFLKTDEALNHAEKMVKAGADIIDIGGESTRPGSRAVSGREEIDRIIPVIERVKKEFEILVSVDTSKDEVARIAVAEAGADLVNDISGLRFSDNMVAVVASLGVPVIIMHILGTPKNMQRNPSYKDAVVEIKNHLSERIDYAMASGISRNKIIVDPGIGFGKRFQDNIEIIRRLREIAELKCPILIGLSRKSFLGQISGEKIPQNRETETVTANIISILNGASIIRVHQVENMVRALKVLRHLLDFN